MTAGLTAIAHILGQVFIAGSCPDTDALRLPPAPDSGI